MNRSDYNDHSSKYYRELDGLIEEAADHLTGPCNNGPDCEVMKEYRRQMEGLFEELGRPGWVKK